MKRSFILGTIIIGGLLLVGVGCASTRNNIEVQNKASLSSVTGVSPSQDYIVKDWKQVDIKNFTISFPSDFLYIPPLAEAPNVYTWWTADQTIFFTIESLTSTMWCYKKNCDPSKDLVRISGKELYNNWKTDPSNASPNSTVTVDKIDGNEALIILRSSQGIYLAQVSFVYKNVLYTMVQSDAGRYVSGGKPLLLKIIQTIKFK